MSPEQFRESKRVIPQNFDFDEEFDSDCFEENQIVNDPNRVKTQPSVLFSTKKLELAKDIKQVIQKHGLSHDV